MAEFSNPGSLDKKAELTVDLRPTLFIGSGGTGMEVMLRIRRRILSAVWNRHNPVRVDSIAQFPVARFLHFDLDAGAVIDEGKSQRSDPWYELVKLSDEERLVEYLDLPQYHESDDSLARFPLIEKWMPLRPKKLRSLGIDPSKGAGQIRAVARLYLFDKYPKLRGRIKGALNFLGSNAGNERKENYQRLGLQVDTSRFRIVVIASCAGGTGAGSALDLGWLSKAIARQEVADSQVDLVMFLPSGYARANKERTEANAYATLMELETAMRDMNAQVRWMEPDSLVGKGAPFDDVYFVDNANLAGKKAIGILSLENAPGGSDGYHFGNLDNTTPSVANATAGLYDFFVEQSLQWRNQTVAGVPAPAGSLAAFLSTFLVRSGDPAITSTLAGVAALPTNYDPTAYPAGQVMKGTKQGNTCAPTQLFY